MVYTTFLFRALGCLLVAAREAEAVDRARGLRAVTMAVDQGPIASSWWGCSAPRRGRRAASFARVSRLHWKTGLLLAAIAAAPWFVWICARFGDAFVQGYVLAGNLYYVTRPASFAGRAVSHAF